MTAYYIRYNINGKTHEISIDARDLKSAKNKIGKKHGYKTGRNVKIEKTTVIGYF